MKSPDSSYSGPSRPSGEETTLVFVYGTLKRGGDNHHYLADQRFHGEARIPAGHTIYAIGYFPGMVADPEDKNGVTGELWEVDAQCLAQLDALEGVDEELYARIRIALAPPAHRLIVETYLFLQSVEGRPHIGPTWVDPLT